MLPAMHGQPPAHDDAQRYARHLALAEVGTAGQERLRRASVLIIGAGGLGSPAALYLAAAGVGTLGLADFDHVDLSNLQRQVLFDTSDVGRPKVEAARERLQALNPGIRVVAHAVKVEPAGIADLFAPYDLVIDGCDRLATRYLVNDACVLLGKPLVSAAIHRFEGQAMTYMPGKGPCYRCLFPDGEAALVPSCAEAGVLGVLPGVMGSLQATEALKLLLGIGEPLVGRFLVYDALSLQFQEFRFTRRSDCAVCGDSPRITSLTPAPEPGLAHIDVWTPEQLAQHLKSADAGSHVLVDVREPQEWAAGRIPGSVHIPLGSLQARFDEIPADRRPVFLCAAGARSMAACRFAAQSGRDAINLDGGLYAWTAAFGPPPAP